MVASTLGRLEVVMVVPSLARSSAATICERADERQGHDGTLRAVPSGAEIEVRRSTPEDEPAILALAAAALEWAPGEASVGLYRWKHDESPFGASPRWVATDEGRVVGFRVFMRWEFLTAAGQLRRAVRA